MRRDNLVQAAALKFFEDSGHAGPVLKELAAAAGQQAGEKFMGGACAIEWRELHLQQLETEDGWEEKWQRRSLFADEETTAAAIAAVAKAAATKPAAEDPAAEDPAAEESMVKKRRAADATREAEAVKKQKKDEEDSEEGSEEDSEEECRNSSGASAAGIPRSGPKIKHCFTPRFLRAKGEQEGAMIIALKYGEHYSLAEIIEVYEDAGLVKLRVLHTLDPNATVHTIIPDGKKDGKEFKGFKFNEGLDNGHLWMKATKGTRARYIDQKKLKGTLSLSLSFSCLVTLLLFF